MACEDEKKKVQDLLKKLQDFREMQRSSGLSKFALQVAWAVKYGTDDVGILSIRNELEEAQEKLALCMGVRIVRDVPIIGNIVAALADLI